MIRLLRERSEATAREAICKCVSASVTIGTSSTLTEHLVKRSAVVGPRLLGFAPLSWWNPNNWSRFIDDVTRGPSRRWPEYKLCFAVMAKYSSGFQWCLDRDERFRFDVVGRRLRLYSDVPPDWVVTSSCLAALQRLGWIEQGFDVWISLVNEDYPKYVQEIVLGELRRHATTSIEEWRRWLVCVARLIRMGLPACAGRAHRCLDWQEAFNDQVLFYDREVDRPWILEELRGMAVSVGLKVDG